MHNPRNSIFFLKKVVFNLPYTESHAGSRYILDGETSKETLFEQCNTVNDKLHNPDFVTNLNWLPESIKDFILPAGFPGSNSISSSFLKLYALFFRTFLSCWYPSRLLLREWMGFTLLLLYVWIMDIGCCLKFFLFFCRISIRWLFGLYVMAVPYQCHWMDV